MLWKIFGEPALVGPVAVRREVVRAERARRWIRFTGERISAARLVAGVLAVHEVKDLSIVEPDIEDVIRRIYRGETRPTGAAPQVTDWQPDHGR